MYYMCDNMWKNLCIICVIIWQKLHSARRRLFLPANWIKFEEETNKMLHLEHGFVWC